MSLRVGQGFDAHRFAATGTGRELWLAGLHWTAQCGAARTVGAANGGAVDAAGAAVDVAGAVDGGVICDTASDAGDATAGGAVDCAAVGTVDYEGIEGDSDGDVAVHALIDALLSASSLGDIGTVFGVGADAHGAGMHGVDMLGETVCRLRHAGCTPMSASVTIIGNRPKIGTRRHEAEATLGKAAGCHISITATTTDGMGFTGRGEGVAAIASALVEDAGSHLSR